MGPGTTIRAAAPELFLPFTGIPALHNLSRNDCALFGVIYAPKRDYKSLNVSAREGSSSLAAALIDSGSLAISWRLRRLIAEAP
jgi:hypothetical protein